MLKDFYYHIINEMQEQKDMIRNVSEVWTGDEGKFSFTAKGFEITGNINVDMERVTLNGKLPFALFFFSKKRSARLSGKNWVKYYQPDSSRKVFPDCRFY